MAGDFTRRSRGARLFSSTFSRSGGALAAEYALARRAGAAVAPVLRPFRMTLRTDDPAHCRIEGRTLVILAENATQLSRLRQLTGRMSAALAAKGLPIDAIETRIVPKSASGIRESIDLPCSPRAPSAAGAAAVASVAATVRDEELRRTLERLSRSLSPDPSAQRERLAEKLSAEALRLAEERMERSGRAKALESEIAALAVPAERDAALYPRLAAARKAGLAEKSALESRLGTERARLEAIERRLAALGQALGMLERDPAGAAALAYDMTGVTLRDEEPLPRGRRHSAAAAAALSELSRTCGSAGLQKTARELSKAIAPSEGDFAASLLREAEGEIAKLEAAPPSQEKEKRLAALREARRALRSGTADAEALAARLYGAG